MMDISVSHLNSRLALQLPTELPLGLVFVVGTVQNLTVTNGNKTKPEATYTSFDLVETDYRLHCRLTPRAAAEITLQVGEQVRTGGHLTFDSHQANYYLLVRDIELMQEQVKELEPAATDSIDPKEIEILSKELVGRQALTPKLADIKRRAESTKLAQAELPDWVQRIAPLEVQQQQTETETTSSTSRNQSEKTTKQMNEKLIRVLSDAMEDKQDIELTPDMIAILSPASVTESSATTASQPYKVPPPVEEPVSIVPPSQPTSSDSLVTWLLIVFIVLSFIAIVTAVLLVVQS